MQTLGEVVTQITKNYREKRISELQKIDAPKQMIELLKNSPVNLRTKKYANAPILEVRHISGSKYVLIPEVGTLDRGFIFTFCLKTGKVGTSYFPQIGT
jgi:hypothetical protein